MNTNNRRTAEQQAIVDQLGQSFEIDTEKILFLNRLKPLEPWLSYDALVAIARRSGDFSQISESYSEYIPELKQLVHTATVVDPQGRIYMRSGAATIGEKLVNEEAPDEHSLAAARALKAVLDAAGFNPLKAASVVELKLPPKEHLEADQAASRLNDLKIIHLLAAQKGLIKPHEDDPETNDLKPYRDWLTANFGVNTAAKLGPADRAAAINMLRGMPEQLAAVA